MLVLYIAFGIAAFIAISLLWTWLDGQMSIKYRDTMTSELEEHVSQFTRRAFRRAEMHIQAESTVASVRLRKWYEYGSEAIVVFVIFEGVSRRDGPVSHFRRQLKTRETTSGFGLSGCYKYRDLFTVKCEDAEEVYAIVLTGLSSLYDLSNDETYTVFTKGSIENGDVVCNGMCSKESLRATMSRHWGRPYLRSQIPGGSFYVLGWMVGSVWWAVRTLLGIGGKDK